MSSPQKRVNPDPGSPSKKSKKGKAEDHEDPLDAFNRQHLELERLVSAMELEEAPSHCSWQSISMRAERAQALWQSVAPRLTQRRRSNLEARVQNVCQRALEIADDLAKKQTDDPVNQIFFGNNGNQGSDNPSNDTAEPVKATAPPEATQVPSSRSRKPKNGDLSATVAPESSIKDLQKTQREQMESAISQMASQMKEETSKIHSTLTQQTKGILAEMENAATENVEQVSKVAQDVKEHVSRSWKRTIGTWTMIFTIVGAFLFCLVTIQLAPKRPGACIFFCEQPENSAKTHQNHRNTLEGTSREVERQQTCELDVNGDCLVRTMSSEDVSQQAGNDASLSSTEILPDDSAADPTEDSLIENSDRADRNIQGSESGDESLLSDIHFPAEVVADDVLKEYMETVAAAQNGPPAMQSPPDVSGSDIVDDPFAGFEAAQENVNDSASADKRKPSLLDLHVAIARGDAELLREYLLDSPELINQVDEHDWTCLHFGAHEGREEVIYILLEMNAPLRMTTKDGKTPLDLSLERHGPNHPVSSILRKEFYRTQEFTAADLRRAAELNHIEDVRGYLSINPELVNEGDPNKWTALHLATRAGHTEVVQALIAAGADTSLKTGNGKASIQIARERLAPDHPVREVLEGLATENRAQSTDTPDQEQQPTDANESMEQDELDDGVREDDEDEEEEDGEDIESEEEHSRDEEVLLAMQTAAAYGDVEVLKLYLASHPYLKDAVDDNGWSPLHLAASNGQVGSLRALLQSGCNPWAENHAGETPFDISFTEFGENHPVTTMLNEAETLDMSRMNELMDAIERGDAESLQTLVSAKPYFNEHEVTATALHRAVTGNQLACARILLEADWQIDTLDQGGRSVVDLAHELYEEDHPILSLLDEYD